MPNALLLLILEAGFVVGLSALLCACAGSAKSKASYNRGVWLCYHSHRHIPVALHQRP